MSLSLRNSCPAAARAGGFRANQFGGRAIIPDIGGVLAEKLHHAIQNLAIRHRLLAVLAIKHDDRHAPDALARDAPIGTRGDHVGHALFAPGGHPLHVFDGLERARAQIVALHADEPLLGGAKDGRVVAAPAMRIAVLDLFFAQQRAVRFQNFGDDGIRLPDRFSDDLFGKAAGRAFGMIRTCRPDPPDNRSAGRISRRLRSLPGRGRERCEPRRCPARA